VPGADHLEHPEVHCLIILKWIIMEQGKRLWTDSYGSGYGAVALVNTVMNFWVI
jgi:hypothetical protein